MSPQLYPRAVDLAQMAHCSVCGETNPITDDGGDTTCCLRRECPGMGPEAQDVCCGALQDRVDHEAAYGTPASPLSVSAQVKPSPARSARIDETQDLQSGSVDANLMSHTGGAAPITPDPKEPAMATSAHTTAVFEALFADDHNFDSLGYGFGSDRTEYERAAKATLGDKSELTTKQLNGADWDEIFEHFHGDGEPEAPEAPEAPAKVAEVGEWDADDRYMGYDVLASAKGRAWHVGRRNDEAVCHAKVDRRIGLEDAAAMRLCIQCCRYLGKHGVYVPSAPVSVPAPVAEAPAPAAARKAVRESLGAASATGWELLYDKPQRGAEVGRRYVEGRPQYALICKAHGHVHELPRLTAERALGASSAWCPSC